MNRGPNLECWVYRSARKSEMYLYLRQEDDFSCLPEELLARFGKPTKVMPLSLNPQRKLAREDVNNVMENLRNKGFHLQLPPKMQADLYYGD